LEKPVTISADIASSILSVGPDYLNHRGGVGAVISVYSRYFDGFKFIATHKNGSVIFKSFFFLLSLIKLVHTLITDRKIKIVHIHGASYGSFYRKFAVFILGKYLFGKKIIYHIHGGGFKVFYNSGKSFSKRLIRKMIAHADIVITLSESWRDYYMQNFDAGRLIIIPNIIDYPAITDKAVKHETVNFLYLGLISDAKGIFDLIEVIAAKQAEYRSKIRLTVGGNGEVERLKRLIEKYNINDIVAFLGWVSGREKEVALNDSDIYILPSYNEGMPVSVLESMSYGKAIISTKVGGIPEIVRNGVNGLLIDPGKLKQLEDAMDLFIESPELIRKYGDASELIVQKHLPHSVINELLEIYQSLLK
jgi:glycosyltransferase involved in cell wall biosynthesis